MEKATEERSGSNTSIRSKLQAQVLGEEEESLRSFVNRDRVNKWMAFERGSAKQQLPSDTGTRTIQRDNDRGDGDSGGNPGSSDRILTEASMTERTAEWGLYVRSDVGEGSFKATRFTIRSSGDGNQSKNSSERFTMESIGTSEDSSLGDSLPVSRVSQELKEALATLQQIFVVSDATKPDCPILYASSGFFTITGYSSNEIIGRNCRFLQGPKTDQNEVAKIRATVKTGKSYCGRLLNYKKDGTPFWNLLTLTPIKDDKGSTIRFIGMQVEVSKYTEGIVDKAVRPNGLPQSLIRNDAC